MIAKIGNAYGDEVAKLAKLLEGKVKRIAKKYKCDTKIVWEDLDTHLSDFEFFRNNPAIIELENELTRIQREKDAKGEEDDFFKDEDDGFDNYDDSSDESGDENDKI